MNPYKHIRVYVTTINQFHLDIVDQLDSHITCPVEFNIIMSDILETMEDIVETILPETKP